VLGLRLQSWYVLKLDMEFWGRNEMETTAVLKPPPGDYGVHSTPYVRPPSAFRLNFSINSSLCEPTRPDTTLVTARGANCKEQTRE
jgi:hypothetical protein